MASLEELSKRQAESKVDRKLGYTAQRRLGLEARTPPPPASRSPAPRRHACPAAQERRREAERRKADALKSCGVGGMKHTAAAMIARG